MSSTALARVADNLPVSWWHRRRLKQVLRGVAARRAKLTFEMLLRKADPIEPELLSMLLTSLVERGLVRRTILVENGDRGLDKFDSIDDIPSRVWDGVENKWVEVTLDHLRVLYEFG